MGCKKGELLKTAFETYTVEGPIGSGGSGEVYKVRDSDGRPFAAKVLDPKKATANRLKRFKNEINFCSKAVHPNIIQVSDTGITDSGATFYVMPVYGCTLRELISKGIGADDVLPQFEQILSGIEAAHLRQVWHRDTKPENILCTADGRSLVIADFGIAHFEEDEILTVVNTKDNERLANFQYSAPEQRTRGRTVDGKSDVYAAGLILNEMFTGAVPEGSDIRKISDVAPGYSYLDDLVDLMRRQDPVQRPSVQDVKRELIARGNQFVTLQRLDQLKKEVVPETEISDSVVADPIKILEVDYRNGSMIFTLSAAPPPQWIREFQNPRGSFTYYPSATPQSFTINGNHAIGPFEDGMDPRMYVSYARSFVDLANHRYVEFVTEQHQKRIAAERAALTAKIEEQERRKKILSALA